MKPNLIDFNIFKNELKIVKNIQKDYEYTIFNIGLILLLLLVCFMALYVFRDKNSKEKKKEKTIDQLKYILEKSNLHLEREQNVSKMINDDVYRDDYNIDVNKYYD